MLKNKAVISIGSNLPSRFGSVLQTVLEAVDRLEKEDGLTVIKQSPIYRTKSWPEGSDQPDYANMAILIEVQLDAQILLEGLQKIENAMGRTRDARWGSRVIDLDLLAYEDIILPNITLWHQVAENEDPAAFIEEATVPHPRLHKRPFAMIPFADVYPDWVHPVLQLTATEISAGMSGGKKQPLELYGDKETP